jgi:hypothetical protein
LVLLRVFLPIQFVMNYIINARDQHSVSRFEHVTNVCHLALVPVLDLTVQAGTVSTFRDPIVGASLADSFDGQAEHGRHPGACREEVAA